MGPKELLSVINGYPPLVTSKKGPGYKWQLEVAMRGVGGVGGGIIASSRPWRRWS